MKQIDEDLLEAILFISGFLLFFFGTYFAVDNGFPPKPILMGLFSFMGLCGVCLMFRIPIAFIRKDNDKN